MQGYVLDSVAYFVPGAPCSISQNLRPERGLSNGTLCRLHQCYLSAEESADKLDEMRRAAPGTIVMLYFPPFAVTVAVRQIVRDNFGLGFDADDCAIVPIPLFGGPHTTSPPTWTRGVPTRWFRIV